MTDIIPSPSPAPEELASKGEKIYFGRKDELEKTKLGQYAVIEVDSGEIFTDIDKLIAIQEAKKKYPDKLFYIVQIGNLKQSLKSEIGEVKRYGWTF